MRTKKNLTIKKRGSGVLASTKKFFSETQRIAMNAARRIIGKAEKAGVNVYDMFKEIVSSPYFVIGALLFVALCLCYCFGFSVVLTTAVSITRIFISVVSRILSYSTRLLQILVWCITTFIGVLGSTGLLLKFIVSVIPNTLLTLIVVQLLTEYLSSMFCRDRALVQKAEDRGSLGSKTRGEESDRDSFESNTITTSWLQESEVVQAPVMVEDRNNPKWLHEVPPVEVKTIEYIDIIKRSLCTLVEITNYTFRYIVNLILTIITNLFCYFIYLLTNDQLRKRLLSALQYLFQCFWYFLTCQSSYSEEKSAGGDLNVKGTLQPFSDGQVFHVVEKGGQFFFIRVMKKVGERYYFVENLLEQKLGSGYLIIEGNTERLYTSEGALLSELTYEVDGLIKVATQNSDKIQKIQRIRVDGDLSYDVVYITKPAKDTHGVVLGVLNDFFNSMEVVRKYRDEKLSQLKDNFREKLENFNEFMIFITDPETHEKAWEDLGPI
jgi:hypothetical protein